MFYLTLILTEGEPHELPENTLYNVLTELPEAQLRGMSTDDMIPRITEPMTVALIQRARERFTTLQ